MLKKKYTTDAINLRSFDLNDSDKIVVMYSKDYGLIRSVAKGVKQPKNKLGARMDNLMANSLQFSKGRSLDVVCQAQTLNSFKKIREDMLKLFCSSYISEVVSIFGLENDPTSVDTYNLLYDALESISSLNQKKDVLLVVLKFQLKIMKILGIYPELNKCLACGKKLADEDMFFSQEYCGVFCSNCNREHYANLKLNYKLRDFLNELSNTDFNHRSEYELKSNDKVCIVCFNLLKDYLIKHSDKKFKSDKVLAEIL